MLRLLFVALAAVLQWRAVSPTAQHEQRLRDSDIGARAPDAFVARLVLTNRRDRKPHEIEVWRTGTERLLVRFLDASERGRYLLRRGQDMWLLTPDAKQPVKLNPAYRVYSGVNLDEILGVRLQRDYRLTAVEDGQADDGQPLTAFELRATGAVTFPSLRHVVRNRDARPVTTEYRLASGKAASVIEYAEWSLLPVLHARRFAVRDELRKGEVAEVEIVSLQARPVPDDLFDLADSAGRRRLEAAPPAPR
jgi:PAS domain-containing protein